MQLMVQTVKAHSGESLVDSQEGEGSTFTIKLTKTN